MCAATNSYYDRYWSNEGWITRPPLELIELLGGYIGRGDECLDVGCGDGGTAGVWLTNRVARYIGVDISETALETARKRGLEVHSIADASELPFEDRSFDVAVCIEVLEHLFEPQRALAEIRRILRPGGRLIVTVPNVAHWRNRIDLALFGRWNPRGDSVSVAQPWRDPHLRFFTFRSLARLIELCGFIVVARGGYDQHGLAHHLPGVRRLAGRSTASGASRWVAERHPRLFAVNIYVVARAADPETTG